MRIHVFLYEIYLPYKVVYSLLFLSGVISMPLIFNLVFTTHRGVVVRTFITPGMNIYIDLECLKVSNNIRRSKVSSLIEVYFSFKHFLHFSFFNFSIFQYN